MKVVYTLRHRLHHPQHEFEGSNVQEPLEHPGRAEIIRAALAADTAFEFIAPDEYGTEPIAAVHDAGLIQFLETAWEEYQRERGHTHDVVPDVFAMSAIREGMSPAKEPTAIGMRLGWWCYEITTPLTQGTYEAARSAVDVALTAADHVLNGERVAYGLCRPPGHHAARALYGGYCFFNNAAVVAQHVATTTGGKVSVLDVDYHHGNGQQDIFYERADVLTVSIHRHPTFAYPYFTGFADERGAGKGKGANVNYPLGESMHGEAYVRVLRRALARVRKFDPRFLVVCLGLDTAQGDPTGSWALKGPDFERNGLLIGRLALPTLVVQEGGYNSRNLGAHGRHFFEGLWHGAAERGTL